MIALFFSTVQPCGVLYDYDENILISNGFLKCFDQPYSWPTTSSDLAGCMAYEFVFVGAKSSSSSSTFALGAFGTSNVFTVPFSTDTAYYDSGGAYWFRCYPQPYNCFGFASSSRVTLLGGDYGEGSDDCASRLSWNLDQSTGGYRVGCIIQLWYDSTWRKVIYGGNTAYACVAGKSNLTHVHACMN